MVFDGTKESCPNYNPDNKFLDTSYKTFISEKVINSPYYGTEDFNNKCFDICATKDFSGVSNGATYIEDGVCNKCKQDLINDDPNNPTKGSKKYLIKKNLWQMCNVRYDKEGGGDMIGDTPLWFSKQQEEKLFNNINIPNFIEGNIGPNNEERNIPVGFISGNTGPENSDDKNDISSINSFKKIISGIQYDTAFEDCINTKLNTDEEGKDFEIQNRIAEYRSVKEFTQKDINYIKRKLRKIINMDTRDIQECASLLNLGKSMCEAGIADKTLMIGKLIFSIVGNNKINIMETDNEEKYKINILIDQLGPLIPKAVKNIIKVSKEYETRVCNFPSDTTLLLERIYDQTYDKQTNVSLDISPYFDFDSLIKLDGVTFVKTIVVLIVFAFLFMHAANLVIAFLSRGSTNTN